MSAGAIPAEISAEANGLFPRAGEEAKIVVISLVRSNEEHKCGFLKTDNRVNVLLSRAKHGMYIIGDSETARQGPMWGRVIGMLEEKEIIGPALALQCPRHPDTPIYVWKMEDFTRLSPEGGCSEPCAKPLNCGIYIFTDPAPHRLR